METADRIFWGTLFSDTDDYFLDSADGRRKVDLAFRQDRNLGLLVEDEGLDEHHEVSILGHMGEDPRFRGPCILVHSIVSHEEVALRAFEIYQARGGSALDNWLVAETELLQS